MMSVHAWGEIVFIIKAAVTARGCQQCAAPAAKSFSGYFVKISCQPQIKVVMEKVTLPVPQPLYLLIHCHRQSQSQMYYFIHTNNKTTFNKVWPKNRIVKSSQICSYTQTVKKIIFGQSVGYQHRKAILLESMHTSIQSQNHPSIHLQVPVFKAILW